MLEITGHIGNEHVERKVILKITLYMRAEGMWGIGRGGWAIRRLSVCCHPLAHEFPIVLTQRGHALASVKQRLQHIYFNLQYNKQSDILTGVEVIEFL